MSRATPRARPTASDDTVTSTARVVAGIDEAGLGPLLGPLALGWSVLRLPEPGADPWRLLRGRVRRRPGRRPGLVVADSKRVFSRNHVGLVRLETTVLTFLALRDPDGVPPRDPARLLFGPDGVPAELLRSSPWYGRLPELPRATEAGALELGAALLAKRMRERGLALEGAGVRVVPARELNRSWDATNNKGTTTWTFCRDALRHLWAAHGEEGLAVTVDLLGGRIHYADLLARDFEDARVTTLFEGPEHSAYVLDQRDAEDRWMPRRMRVDFRAKGEEASFAVALGSCLAKYARELVMAGFNAYFEELEPDLAPTAGYTTDGRRWLDEARQAIQTAGVARGDLVRSR